MGSICWPYFDPEYETLNQRINPPRVSIDNATCSDCTLVKEYYIRHMDGCTLNTETERNCVIRSLEAAILRRVSDGVSLELSARDRVGLLSDVTRVLRENGLTVMRAEVSTVGAKAVNVFYVRDASGNPVDMKTIESLRKEIGHTMLLNVKAPDLDKPSQSVGTTKFSFSFGRLFWKFLP